MDSLGLLIFWRRQEQKFTIAELIGTLDVEEKERAKNISGKEVVGASANFVQNNNSDEKNNSIKVKGSHN